MAYTTFPFTPSIPVAPFKVNVPQSEVDDLASRVANGAPRQRTWDNGNGPYHLGIRAAELDSLIHDWKTKFNWRNVEDRINFFPNYVATVKSGGHEYKVHFIALFSENKDAVPIVFNHGWPGSILEFLPMLHHVQATYTPKSLPNHILVPSLIGYGFSSPPPVDLPNFTAVENAAVLNTVLEGLGFKYRSGRGTGYLLQGGDIGSFVSRNGEYFESCRGIHLNFFPLLGRLDGNLDVSSLDEVDKKAVARGQKWQTWGMGYYAEQSTKPATIGAVLESSPIGLLAWIGEKFLHAGHSNDFVLSEVSLYWFTHTAATCLWHYRSSGMLNDPKTKPLMPRHISKPLGYSQFMMEIFPTPISWVRTKGNLVWARRHNEGGHFAALDRPQQIWEDVQAFSKIALGTGTEAKL